MICFPVGRFFLGLFLAAVVAVAILGCREKPTDLELLSEQVFTGLSVGSPVVLPLHFSAANPVLVRVDGFETDLVSMVLDDHGQTLSRVRLPYLRVVPAFHVVDSDKVNGSPELVIRTESFTRYSNITVSVFELPNESSRDQARIEAYRAFESATQSTEDEAASVWLVRTALLRAAASGFGHSGDKESLLWAQYLEAYYHYFPLRALDHAAAMAAEIRERAKEQGFQKIELMALELEGQALIERGEGDTLEAAEAKAEHGQLVLQQAVDLAAQMGYRFEQAWALNSMGIGYFYQNRHDAAEQEYRRAVDIARDLEDKGFAIRLQGNLALARERQGDLEGALAELQAINAQLFEAGATADLAHNFSELSRLYERLYLFPESIEAQTQAMSLWRSLNSAEGKGRSGLSLAHAYQAIGNAPMALTVLTQAIADMQAARFSRGLRDGYGLLARLHRGQGQYQLMSEAREREGEYLSSEVHEAKFRYESGLDALAQFPDAPALAEELFEEAESAAGQAGDAGLELRARLQRCAIATQVSQACEPSSLSIALDEMLPVATPREAVETQFLLTQTLARAGDLDEAWAVIDGLVDEIQFYRRSLPGVLGAWYWEGRARIFDLYMQLALRAADESKQRVADSLLAFDRLLNTPLSTEIQGGYEGEVTTSDGPAELRSLLARLESSNPQNAPEIRQAIDRRLLEMRAEAPRAQEQLDPQGLDALLANLPPGAGMLAYYLTPGDAWAWLALSEGVRGVRLGNGKEVFEVLERARTGLRVVGNKRLNEDLQQLGNLLLAPFGSDLPETIYVLAAGPLAGFPFDAIRMNGRYVGQDHNVVNALSLRALERAAEKWSSAQEWQVFLLAGNPLTGNGLAALPSASRELDGLAELLKGGSVTSATGTQLDPGLFGRTEFASADVIHLASHARIDLEYPELSRLMVSSIGGQETFLTPLDLRGTAMNADLVVLSACETSGVNNYYFDSNLGFVSAFLESGAGAVVATLWPVGDAFATDFVLAFYAALLDGKNTPQALAEAKRRMIAEAAASGLPAWPAFQIYVN